MTDLENALLNLSPQTVAVLDEVLPPQGPLTLDITKARLAVERARVALIRRELTAAAKEHSTEVTAAFLEAMVDAMFPQDDAIEAYLAESR
jgi:predicted class III extradiol MEMO1 family dioxygenase